MTRRAKLVMAILGVALFVMGFVIGRGIKFVHDGFYEMFDEPHRYVECDPGLLLPYLKEQLGLTLPADARNIYTARTWGVWDSTNSGFLVRFVTSKENVADFQAALGDETIWKEYEAASDERESHWPTPPPPWFTSKIYSGKIGERMVSPIGLEIHTYIDCTGTDKVRVYCHGIYARPKEDFQSAFGGN